MAIPILDSCKKGWTDKGDTNYDDKAKKDDESCVFREKTNSTNNASVAGGDLYFVLKDTPKEFTGVEVYVNAAYIGLLQRGCTENLDCEATCEKIQQLNLAQGSHSYYTVAIRATTSSKKIFHG